MTDVEEPDRPSLRLPAYDVVLTPMRRADFPLLARWLAEDHVAAWWVDEPTMVEGVEAKYGPCLDGTDPTELFVVHCSGRPVGMAQRYLVEDYPAWIEALTDVPVPKPAAGFDYLIGEPDCVGRGMGTALIGALVPATFDRYPSAAAIVVDVSVANRGSWRVLELNGFTRVWEGELDSPDPSDAGPTYVYVLPRT